jgi:4-hydroxybenzoyl-CoA reductase subunit alpha
VGATADGKLKAVDAKTLLDGGAYSSFGLVTTYYSGQLLCGAVRNARRTASTPRASSPTSRRAGRSAGTGACSPASPSRCTLDKLAERLGIDPIELRRRNFMGRTPAR